MRSFKQSILLLLFIASISSCQKKTAILLDAIEGQPEIDPSLSVFLKPNSLLAVDMNKDGSITGIGTKNVFKTTTNFKTLELYEYYASPNVDKLHRVNNNLFFYLSQSQATWLVHCSEDFGKTWNSFIPELEAGGPLGAMWNIADAFYKEKNSLVITMQTVEDTWTGTTYRTVFYDVNPLTRKAILLSQIEGFIPHRIRFISNVIGFAVLNKAVKTGYNSYDTQNTYVSKTTNGGRTWSEPVLVNTTSKFNLEVGSENALFLHIGPSASNIHSYFSADGGSTWKNTGQTDYFQSVSYTTDKILYALTHSGLLKSEDGGEHWKQVRAIDDEFHGITGIKFIDELKGIAFSTGKTLLLTEDGGVHWKRLLYPYPYLVE